MNIAIIGRTETLFRTAELLIAKGHKVKLVVTAQEAPEYTRTVEDFENLARSTGATFLCTPKISSPEILEELRHVSGLDIGISMNYVSVISQKVSDLFAHGILNAHGGDLPRYKGNACQAWAIVNGEERIGVCIHRMIGGLLDSGDIIEREYFNVDMNTKIGHIYKWMDQCIPYLFLSAVSKIEHNPDYILEKWNSDGMSIRCYPRLPEDGKVDWNKSNKEILRLVNASSEPYSGAFCMYKEKGLVIWDAELFDDGEQYCAVPGQVSSVDTIRGSVIVITGQGKIRINEVEYEGVRSRPSEVIRSIRTRLA